MWRIVPLLLVASSLLVGCADGGECEYPCRLVAFLDGTWTVDAVGDITHFDGTEERVEYFDVSIVVDQKSPRTNVVQFWGVNADADVSSAELFADYDDAEPLTNWERNVKASGKVDQHGGEADVTVEFKVFDADPMVMSVHWSITRLDNGLGVASAERRMVPAMYDVIAHLALKDELLGEVDAGP